MTDHRSSDGAASTAADDADLDALLADAQRRRCLLALLAATDGVTIDTRWADDAGRVPADDRRLLLYHDHLRPLARAELIEWDPRTDRITRGQRFEAVEPLLRALVARSERSDRAATVVGGGAGPEGGEPDDV